MSDSIYTETRWLGGNGLAPPARPRPLARPTHEITHEPRTLDPRIRAAGARAGAQVLGRCCGESRDSVHSPNYGRHTMRRRKKAHETKLAPPRSVGIKERNPTGRNRAGPGQDVIVPSDVRRELGAKSSTKVHDETCPHIRCTWLFLRSTGVNPCRSQSAPTARTQAPKRKNNNGGSSYWRGGYRAGPLQESLVKRETRQR